MAYNDTHKQALAKKYGHQYSKPINIEPSVSAEMQNKIEHLVLALGQMTGTILKHKLDIEDEAYEVIMDELSEITNNVMSKL